MSEIASIDMEKKTVSNLIEFLKQYDGSKEIVFEGCELWRLEFEEFENQIYVEIR